MDKFSEDNFYRIMTNLSVCSRPISLRRQLSQKEFENLDMAISDVTDMMGMFHDRFASQFKHDPRKRRCCPNDNCQSIYAYFYDDFHYCPKCGTKLEGVE